MERLYTAQELHYLRRVIFVPQNNSNGVTSQLHLILIKCVSDIVEKIGKDSAKVSKTRRTGEKEIRLHFN